MMKYLFVIKKGNRLYAKVIGANHISIIDDEILFRKSDWSYTFQRIDNGRIISLSEFFKGTDAFSQRVRFWG